jgi:hypothetical protein
LRLPFYPQLIQQRKQIKFNHKIQQFRRTKQFFSPSTLVDIKTFGISGFVTSFFVVSSFLPFEFLLNQGRTETSRGIIKRFFKLDSLRSEDEDEKVAKPNQSSADCFFSAPSLFWYFFWI